MITKIKNGSYIVEAFNPYHIPHIHTIPLIEINFNFKYDNGLHQQKLIAF